MYAKHVKRKFDFIIALSVIVVFFPLYLFLTVAGAIAMRGNPFFFQERPGLHEKIFKMVKFRTMTNKKDKNGELLPDEIRLNAYGRFLRSTSLDELPEMFNILSGDMSLIGPRPLVVSYLPWYTEEEHHRHDVRPGLTGYAQVHGRNYVTWEDKFKMDLWYVNHLTFLTDLKIFWDSIFVVLKRESIETGSKIVHDGVVYQPMDIERRERMEKAEAEKKAKAEAAQKAEAEKKAKAEAVQKAEAEKKAKAEAAQKAEAEKKAKAEAEQKAEAENKAKAEAAQKAEADNKEETGSVEKGREKADE